ncbi:MAG: viroplasmin family protein [Fusobacteriaceae bacterium]
MAKAQKFYAYYLTEEKKMGIETSWDVCKKIVAGKLARYKSFSTEYEAKAWLEGGAKYEPNPELQEKKKKKKSENLIAQSKLQEAIYFDSGTGRGIGVEIRVTNLSGNSLLEKYFPEKTNEYGNIALGENRTNNFGELAALYHALDIAMREKNYKIFGDSNLIIYFWSLGRYNKSELPEETIKLINIVMERRKVFESEGGKIDFVSGDINPADLGFHKS